MMIGLRDRNCKVFVDSKVLVGDYRRVATTPKAGPRLRPPKVQSQSWQRSIVSFASRTRTSSWGITIFTGAGPSLGGHHGEELELFFVIAVPRTLDFVCRTLAPPSAATA